jgi:hypothetical protein
MRKLIIYRFYNYNIFPNNVPMVTKTMHSNTSSLKQRSRIPFLCCLAYTSLRRSMFVLFLINLYPHYYSWWSYLSYYNEDFYDYYKHHMLFTITEIIAIPFLCCLAYTNNSTSGMTTWNRSGTIKPMSRTFCKSVPIYD